MHAIFKVTLIPLSHGHVQVTRKMAVDAMYKLEHGVGDKTKAKEVDPVLKELEEFQTSRWHDDYGSNKVLRAAMRVCVISFIVYFLTYFVQHGSRCVTAMCYCPTIRVIHLYEQFGVHIPFSCMKGVNRCDFSTID